MHRGDKEQTFQEKQTQSVYYVTFKSTDGDIYIYNYHYQLHHLLSIYSESLMKSTDRSLLNLPSPFMIPIRANLDRMLPSMQ